MHTHSRTLLTLAGLVILTSCKKNKDDRPDPDPQPAAPIPVSAFSQLQAGSYWVYQRYKVDSNDVILSTSSRDSLFIAGDTILNGETYAKVGYSVNGLPPVFIRFWRDSVNYLISANHEVLFCSDPLDQVIYSVYQGPVGVILDYTVHSTPVDVSVPAGDLTTYMMRCTITSIGGYPPQPAWKELRSYWTPGIGRVRWYDFYGASLWGYRYDLVHYHVQ